MVDFGVYVVGSITIILVVTLFYAVISFFIKHRQRHKAHLARKASEAAEKAKAKSGTELRSAYQAALDRQKIRMAERTIDTFSNTRTIHSTKPKRSERRSEEDLSQTYAIHHLTHSSGYSGSSGDSGGCSGDSGSSGSSSSSDSCSSSYD